MTRPIRTLSAATLLAGATLCIAQIVMAPPAMAQNAEVNQRLSTQNQRIDNGLANGTMGTGQAARIQGRDGQIATQEGRMAARDGGAPLTARQDRRLNRELNHTSARIYADKHTPR